MKKILEKKINTGITLIALVITIVVLIILATVIINLSLSDNGIFNRAREAKEEYNNSQEYEETEIAKSTNQIDSYIDGSRNYLPISYSTEEQKTEYKWINNKPIYQKTITGTTGENNTLNIDHNIQNFELCVNVLGYVYQNNSYAVPVGFYNGSSYFSAFSTTTQLNLRYNTSSYSNCPFCITIQYTKTTD